MIESREPDASTDALAHAVIGAAIEVHRHLGPGFLEEVYEEALCLELRLRQIPFERQKLVRIDYKGEYVGEGRLDLLVGDRLVVELKPSGPSPRSTRPSSSPTSRRQVATWPC